MRPNYYFIFCPNNSGTTIMSQYLATQVDGYLPPFGNNEGQFAPAVRQMMRTRRWDPEHTFDWPQIHAAWDALCIEAGKDTFVEASPPNLMRVSAIRQEFDPVARYLFAISSPYAQISSCIYNYTKGPLRYGRLEFGVRKWVRKAEAIRQGMLANPSIPFLSYEEFCADPTRLNTLLDLPVRPRDPLQGKKNTNEREIRDFSSRNIHFLSAREIDKITALLAPHQDLLDHFNIPLEDGKTRARNARRNEPDLYWAAKKRRYRWVRQTLKDALKAKT